MSRLAAPLIAVVLFAASAQAANVAAAMRRMDADFASGRPLVAHVVVALVDNEHQGIVPVPAALGNGADARSNLYWGAMYGVRTYFRRSTDWQSRAITAAEDGRVLDRVAFHRELTRDGRRGEALIVAEAWRGDRIADAIRHFLELNQGRAQSLRVGDQTIEAGGAAHVIVFVGHNGLMDFELPTITPGAAAAPAHAAIVLACLSDQYFSPLLSKRATPILMTTGLMAPEAYTLDAALSSWFAGEPPAQVRLAAARAYARYQRIPERAATRLFLTARE